MRTTHALRPRNTRSHHWPHPKNVWGSPLCQGTRESRWTRENRTSEVGTSAFVLPVAVSRWFWATWAVNLARDRIDVFTRQSRRHRLSAGFGGLSEHAVSRTSERDLVRALTFARGVGLRAAAPNHGRAAADRNSRGRMQADGSCEPSCPSNHLQIKTRRKVRLGTHAQRTFAMGSLYAAGMSMHMNQILCELVRADPGGLR